MFPESAAISAPVFGADGNVAAAIAVGAPAERLQPRLAELRPVIADIATRASGRTRSDADAVAVESARPGKRAAAAAAAE